MLEIYSDLMILLGIMIFTELLMRLCFNYLIRSKKSNTTPAQVAPVVSEAKLVDCNSFEMKVDYINPTHFKSRDNQRLLVCSCRDESFLNGRTVFVYLDNHNTRKATAGTIIRITDLEISYYPMMGLHQADCTSSTKVSVVSSLLLNSGPVSS